MISLTAEFSKKESGRKKYIKFPRKNQVKKYIKFPRKNQVKKYIKFPRKNQVKKSIKFTIKFVNLTIDKDGQRWI